MENGPAVKQVWVYGIHTPHDRGNMGRSKETRAGAGIGKEAMATREKVASKARKEQGKAKGVRSPTRAHNRRVTHADAAK